MVKKRVEMHSFGNGAALRVAFYFGCWMGLALAAAAQDRAKPASDESSRSSPQESEKEVQRQRFLKDAREFCESTRIFDATDVKLAREKPTAELMADPVMRYSDEPRYIPDAGLWVWMKNHHPIAIQKVEINNFNRIPLWTICFASLSEELVTVRWPGAESFKATAPGWEFKPVPNADAPAAKAASRSLQQRAIARRFSGRVVSFLNGDSVELRLMPKPIFEYSDPTTKLPIGAIFGLASNGTNPTLLISVEAKADSEGHLRWEHAHSRMTSEGGHLKLDDATIWEFTPKPPPPRDVDNWTYFFVPHE